MRITIELPSDLRQKIAIDALKKRRNSQEAVITEILRAHYGGGQPHEKKQELLRWRIPASAGKCIEDLRRHAKTHWT